MSDRLEKLAKGFSIAMGVPDDGRLRHYIEKGAGAPSKHGRLLSWQANSIHGYVFSTANATAIRGASNFIRGLDDDLWKGRPLGLDPSQVLFTGGGTGMAVVAEDQAEHAIRKLHGLFAERTRVATCSAAHVPLASDQGSFGDRVREVDQELARRRFLTGSGAEPPVPFFAMRCEVCGFRAANFVNRRGEEQRDRHECEPCRLCIEKGKEGRYYAKEPSSYEFIVGRESGEAKSEYAVLYIDGNGVGRALQRLESPLAFAEFSRSLDRLIKRAFEEAARHFKLLAGEEKDSTEGLRYQRPICGGDDVVAVVPGKFAVPLAREILRRAVSLADDDGNPRLKGLGFSAGVAMGHLGFPIRHLLVEAEALLRNAKKRGYSSKSGKKGDAQGVRGAIDFAFVRDGSPRAGTFEHPRMAQPDDRTMLLSGRPYSLREFEIFASRLRRFQQEITKPGGLGKSQLYTLQRQAQSGPNQLRNHILYQIGRSEHWSDLLRALPNGEDAKLTDSMWCFRQIVPCYNGLSIFDVADMLDLLPRFEGPIGDSGRSA